LLLLRKNPFKRLQEWDAFRTHPWFVGLDFEEVFRRKAPIPDLPTRPGNATIKTPSFNVTVVFL